MYIWNTNALVEDLKRGSLSELEQLKYFLLASILSAARTAYPSNAPEPESLSAGAAVLLAVGLVIAGTVWCFRLNATGDNRDFVSRFLALHVPVGVRLFLVIFVLGMILATVMGTESFMEKVGQPSAFGEVLFASLTALVFYWRIGVAVEKVSGES